MKMDTLRSPCPYDAAARHALQSVDLRRPAILHYALWADVFSISQVVRLPPDSGPSPVDPEIDVMDQWWLLGVRNS